MRTLITGAMSAALVLSFLMPVAHAHSEGDTGKKRIFTKHFQESLFDITGKAAFSIEVLLDDKEHDIGKGMIGIVVHDERDADVAGANLTITRKNRETGESAPGPVSITDKQNGLYIVSGLDLQRKGRWLLAITVKKDNTEDRVNFNLPEAMKERHPKGRYSP